MNWRATAGAVLATAAVAGSSVAGTLSLLVTCTTQEKQLLVNLVNRGTETAHRVTVQCECAGVTNHMAGNVATLAADQPFETRFDLPAFEKAGSYPAVVTVGFEDANGHPFSSVTVHAVAVGSPAPSAVFGVLEGGVVRQSGHLSLRLRNESPAALDLAARTAAARELIADLPSARLNLPARGVLTVPVRIENFSAMPGSTYPLYVILEYDLPGQHACAVASTMVEMRPAQPLRSRLFWSLSLLAVVAVGVAIAAQFRRRA